MSINTDMTVRVAAITQVAEKVKRFRLERARRRRDADFFRRLPCRRRHA